MGDPLCGKSVASSTSRVARDIEPRKRRIASDSAGGFVTTLSPTATSLQRLTGNPMPRLSALFVLHMGHARRRPKRLAEKLLQIRKALGLSQKEMAKRLGNYRTHLHISKYERGKGVPPLEVLLAYARAVGVQMEQIVDDDQNLCFRKALLKRNFPI